MSVMAATAPALAVRNADAGELIVIPNGEIRQVTNLSKDWARVVLDIPLAVDTDVPRATDVLRRISEEIMEDDAWAPVLLDPIRAEAMIDVGGVVSPFIAWLISRGCATDVPTSRSTSHVPPNSRRRARS